LTTLENTLKEEGNRQKHTSFKSPCLTGGNLSGQTEETLKKGQEEDVRRRISHWEDNSAFEWRGIHVGDGRIERKW